MSLRNSKIAHYDSKRGRQQMLGDHLLEVAELARMYAHKLGQDKAGELMGLLHDLGKYSDEFQNYLRSAVGLLDQDVDEEAVDAVEHKGKVDHSTAGAQWLWTNLADKGTEGKLAAQFLALCIASHHSGMIDCVAPDGKDNFSRRINKADQNTHLAEVTSKIDTEIKERLDSLLNDSSLVGGLATLVKETCKGKNAEIALFNCGFLARFIFSCLIDADRTNTRNFERGAPMQPVENKTPEWQVLIDRLESRLNSFVPDSEINKLRKTISDDCKVFSDRERGMYTLTVPTGGGKTLASLRFALHHAKEYSMDRIIYVIPYTSIIDQNARIAREILEPAGVEPGSVVLEHHSNLTPEKDTWQNKTLSQNWDAPVIYTTSVQLLEALFAAGTRDVRRLHRLANAVIVFDEIQTMPIRCVHLFSNAMNFLVAHVKSTVVLCTATQPLLQKVDATKGAIQLSTEPSEMMPDVAGLFEALQRVEVIDQRKPEGWSVEEIAALAVQEQETSCSCLVIVNTKKMALALYEQCGGARNPHLFHLSTNMCPAHRKAKLDNILSRLEPGKEEPTMCISTQLIEAGVDVDFGCVIRSAAGLDSIAQAAGRCNRNARRAKARVYVVNPTDEYLGKLPDISIGKQAYERFAWEYANEPDAFDKNPLGEKALERFFTYYFFDRRGEMAYTVKPPTFEREDTLLNILSFNGKAVEESGRVNKNKTDLILRQSFMSAAQAFKAIDTAAQGVVVPYGPKGVGLINDLCAADEPKKQYPLLRKAQQYTVNVFPNVLEKLQKSGAVHEVQEGTGILYLDKHYYDEATGLVETPTGTMDTLMT